jgi:LytR cell envelope-related transcriptional attenuator
VLNASGVGGAPGVPGLADAVAADVKKAGYKVGNVTDAGTSFEDSLVMYAPDDKPSGEQLADDLRKQLGGTKLLKMSDEIKPLAEGAPVAVVIGLADSETQ